MATSVNDTGLMDELVEGFEAEDPDVGAIKPISGGSGQLFELARKGEVDVIISHEPAGEAQLLEDGDGIDRREFMHNQFVIVGPEDDPAGIASVDSPTEAFRLVAEAGAAFVSRGDSSGTNVRELAIWDVAGLDPQGESWYQESGAGQGQSLLVAAEKGAYTLVDSGTWAVLRERTGLAEYIVDPDALNQYSVTRVNPERHDVSEEGALAFADFLTSPAAQEVIRDFGREEHGEPLFVPDAD